MSRLDTKIAKVIAIIPARFGSTRFPGKMLAPISNKSLIQRTFENVSSCQIFERVIVATDDQRIFDHIRCLGGEAVYTSPECPTGTDRLIEVVQKGQYQDVDCILNIQGDTPLLEISVMEKVASALLNDPTTSMSTAAVPFTSMEDLQNPSIVKCVLDNQQRALYFSRSAIPGAPKGQLKSPAPYYHHLGIYGYKPEFLLELAQLPPTPLQLAEDLEQLKVLEHGYRISVAIVDSISFGVDHPEDIKKVENILCMQNSYSLQAESVRH